MNSMQSFISPSIPALPRKMPSVKSFTLAKKMDCKKIGGGGIVFCNPPYGREIYKWVKKCYEESKKPGTTVVLLIPARTDTRYFHEFIYHKAREIRLIKGRLKFGNATASAPFPSMVVVF